MTTFQRNTSILVLLAFGFLMMIPGVSTFAQEGEDELFVPVYALGDQTLQINLGLFVPLFFALGPQGVAATNLTPGGAGSLAWTSYLTNELTVGAEVGGAFSFTPNARSLFIVPITARGSYIFQAYPFEFPITAGLGLSISRLDDLVKVDPFMKLGGGAFWNFSSQWAFGINALYWLIPQIYTSSSLVGPEATRLGNFLEISLTALYHF